MILEASVCVDEIGYVKTVTGKYVDKIVFVLHKIVFVLHSFPF